MNKIILLKIREENFLFETTQELSMNDIYEIENLCHSANDNESEFNEIRIRDKYEDELYDLSSYDLAEIFAKVILEKLNIKSILVPINIEVKIWL